MDCFKIVSTREKRGIYFTVVPYKWEANGILFWPDHISHSKREVLRSNMESTPDEGWAKYNCVVKCSGIPNFKDALKIEKQLTNCIDTDAEEQLFSDIQTRNNRHGHEFTHRNNLFEECVNNNKSIDNQVVNVISQHTINPSNTDQDPYNTVLLTPDGTVNLSILNEEQPNNSVALIQEIKILENKISNLENDFSEFKREISIQLKEDYIKITANLDKIFRILSTQNKSRNEIVVPKERVDLLKDIKFPLTTCDEISSLETQIRENVEFRKQLIDFLSKIGGCTGVEDGTKVAYKVIDCVFHSEVLMNYSWTGISRGNSGEKQAFQLFDGILGVFFEVISSADNRHTHQKNCSIFKDGVLKHAKKRTARKRVKFAHSSNPKSSSVSHVLTEQGPEDNDGDMDKDESEEDITDINDC